MSCRAARARRRIKEGTSCTRGIAARAFERTFRLADHVRGGRSESGERLLHVDLVRDIPEAMKPPRRIPIGAGRPTEDHRRRVGGYTVQPARTASAGHHRTGALGRLSFAWAPKFRHESARPAPAGWRPGAGTDQLGGPAAGARVSSQKVTGPSLQRRTCIRSPNRPDSTTGWRAGRTREEVLEEPPRGIGMGRRC